MNHTQPSDKAGTPNNGANRARLGDDARSIGNRVEQFASAPSHDQIARRAFEIYLAKNRQPSQCVQNWMQAEHELRRSSTDDLGLGDDDALSGSRADSTRPVAAASDLPLRNPAHATHGSPFGRARAADLKE